MIGASALIGIAISKGLPDTGVKGLTSIGNVSYLINHTLEFHSKAGATIDIDYIIWRDSPPYQQILCKSQPRGLISSFTDDHGNLISRHRVRLPAGASNLTFSYNAFVSLSAFEGNGSEISYDRGSETYKRYTRSERFIECDDSRIQRKAKEITGSTTDPYNASLSVFRWVHKNIKYAGPFAQDFGALWALQNLEGDCTEHAYLFVAMCRSIGIPARCIDGLSNSSIVNGGAFLWKQIGHDWAEVFLPLTGWVWVDPTWGWFGKNDAVHIAIQHGNSGESFYRFTWNDSRVSCKREIFEAKCLDDKRPDIRNASVEPSSGEPGQTFTVSFIASDPSGIIWVTVEIYLDKNALYTVPAKRTDGNSYKAFWNSPSTAKDGQYWVNISACDNLWRETRTTLSFRLTKPLPVLQILVPCVVLIIAIVVLVHRRRTRDSSTGHSH